MARELRDQLAKNVRAWKRFLELMMRGLRDRRLERVTFAARSTTRPARDLLTQQAAQNVVSSDEPRARQRNSKGVDETLGNPRKRRNIYRNQVFSVDG
jgi:hypothetical protein